MSVERRGDRTHQRSRVRSYRDLCTVAIDQPVGNQAFESLILEKLLVIRVELPTHLTNIDTIVGWMGF